MPSARSRSRWRLPLLLLLLALALAVHALHGGRLVLPERWNPWAPLRIEAEPNLLTRFKLARLSGDAALCRSVLAQADMRFRPVPDWQAAPGCAMHNAVRVEATSAAVGPAFLLSCRTAVSLALWERHVVQPAAQRHFGQPVVRIDHLGSYVCRNVYGRPGAPRSQHATADALDVAGFRLAGGQRVQVLKHWEEPGARGRFLQEVGEGACRFFDGALGPAYNAAHRNHLHLDRGGPRVCR